MNGEGGSGDTFAAAWPRTSSLADFAPFVFGFAGMDHMEDKQLSVQELLNQAK